MYTISCETHFDAAHFLKGHGGKCANIHGHRWRVRAYVGAEELIPEGESRGMVIDFGEIKPRLRKIADSLDHGTLLPEAAAALEREGFAAAVVPFRPTAENFAKYIYDELCADGIKPGKVRVYESEDAYAEYSE